MAGIQEHGLPDITVAAIRAHGGNQQDAFESMSYALFLLDLPHGSIKQPRFGTPDGGVETKARLPNGGIRALQAKFFTSSLDQGRWNQLHKSMQSAVKNHPDLTEIYFYVPYDLTPEKKRGGKSQMERWKEFRQKWEMNWRAATGHEINVVHVNETDILKQLGRPEAAAIAKMFYAKLDVFNDACRTLLDDAIQRAGLRYRAACHVEPTFQKQVLRLGGQSLAQNLLGEAVKNIRKEIRWAQGLVGDDLVADATNTVRKLTDDVLNLCGRDRNPPFVGELIGRVNDASGHLKAAQDNAEEIEDSSDKSVAMSRVRSLSNAVSMISDVLEEQAATWTGFALLLEGEAGSGKTHGLIAAAEEMAKDGRPVLFAEARNLATSGDMLDNLAAFFHFDCSGRELMTALQLRAEAEDCRALLIIDGVNENGTAGYWNDQITQLHGRLGDWPDIGIVISYRSEFAEHIRPDALKAADGVVLEHASGLPDLDHKTIMPILNEYGLKPPELGFLPPELRIPILFHMLCERCVQEGRERITASQSTLHSLFDWKIRALNRVAARPENLDYSAHENRIWHALGALARLQLETARPQTMRTDFVEAIASSCKVTRDSAEQLVIFCVHEGLLLDYPSVGGEAWYGFAFDALRDIMIAQILVEELDEAEQVTGKNTLAKTFLESEVALASAPGILTAAMVEFHSRFGVELPMFIEELWHSLGLAMCWLRSLLRRGPEQANEDAEAYLDFLFDASPETRMQCINVLFAASFVDGLPFGGTYLDDKLRAVQWAERDPPLNVVLSSSYQKRGIIHSIVGMQGLGASHRSAQLSLAWMLSSCNRHLRDAATACLVRALDGNPVQAAELASFFATVDDDYIAERTMGVACGVVLRSEDPAAIADAATLIWKIVFAGQQRPHVLFLDYAATIIRRAIALGWDCPDETLLQAPRRPDCLEWPNPMTTLEERWRKKGGNSRGAGSTWRSLAGGGDFDRYIIGTNHGSSLWLVTERGGAQETQDELCKAFVNTLNADQRASYYEWIAAESKHRGLRRILRSRGNAPAPADDGPSPTEAKAKFQGTLDSDKRMLADAYESFLCSPGKSAPSMPPQLVKRFVVEEFLQLPYTREYARFDDSYLVTRDQRMGNPEQERIGKKLQWIAWYRTVARLNWCFHMEDSGWRSPWRDARDIDPSAIDSMSAQVRELARRLHWDQADWSAEPDGQKWGESGAGIPDVGLIIQPATDEGNRWLALDALPVWTSDEDEDGIWRDAFWVIRAYAIPTGTEDDWVKWASQTDFSGRWMPESEDHHSLYLGELSVPAQCNLPPEIASAAEAPRGHSPTDDLGFELDLPSVGYLWERGDMPDRITGAPLIRGGFGAGKLSRGPDLLSWRDDSGWVAMATQEPGGKRKGLYARASYIVDSLAQRGKTVVWALVGERRVLSLDRRNSNLADRRFTGYATLESGEMSVVLRDVSPQRGKHHEGTRSI